MTEAVRAPAHDAIIQESWSRCRDYGLTHQSAPRFDPPAPGDLSVLLESRQALVQTTHQEVLPYYGTILSNSNCLIMLADEQGRLLHSWGDQRFIEPRQAAGFVAQAPAGWNATPAPTPSAPRSVAARPCISSTMNTFSRPTVS